MIRLDRKTVPKRAVLVYAWEGGSLPIAHLDLSLVQPEDSYLDKGPYLGKDGIGGGDGGYVSLLLGPIRMWGSFTQSYGIWLHPVRD